MLQQKEAQTKHRERKTADLLFINYFFLMKTCFQELESWFTFIYVFSFQYSVDLQTPILIKEVERILYFYFSVFPALLF